MDDFVKNIFILRLRINICVKSNLRDETFSVYLFRQDVS